MAVPRGRWLNHHRGRHRRPAAAASGPAVDAPRHYGPRSYRAVAGAIRSCTVPARLPYNRLDRPGSTSGNGSGDIFIAFSTANAKAAAAKGPVSVTMLPNDSLNLIFEATVQATEEAIVNAMVGAETMSGAHGSRVIALPHDRLQSVLRKYNRLK
jgi:hypothetical protein